MKGCILTWPCCARSDTDRIFFVLYPSEDSGGIRDLILARHRVCGALLPSTPQRSVLEVL